MYAVREPNADDVAQERIWTTGNGHRLMVANMSRQHAQAALDTLLRRGFGADAPLCAALARQIEEATV